MVTNCDVQIKLQLQMVLKEMQMKSIRNLTSALEQVCGMQEAQFTSSASQDEDRIGKWWAGICSEVAKDGITQEDNSCAEIGADVN